MVEFAIVSSLLFMLVFGIIDFGNMYRRRISLTNASRDGTRYATTHPTGWSNQQPAPAASIQGRIQASGEASNVPNDDAHIQLLYLDATASPPTQCGHYSQATNAFVADNAYTQATCLKPGNLVEAKLKSAYAFLTPVIAAFYPNGLTMSADATMVMEQ